MKQLDLSNLSQSEKDARLAAAKTVYGVDTRSYNRSAEKKELDRQKADATARYHALPKVEYVVGPICTCRSFSHPHELNRHNELRNDMDWRLESERRGIERRQEGIR